jgi:hypothetical protein
MKRTKTALYAQYMLLIAMACLICSVLVIWISEIAFVILFILAFLLILCGLAVQILGGILSDWAE